MKVYVFLVTCLLLTEVLIVWADKKADSKDTEIKKRADAGISTVVEIVASDDKSPPAEAQRKRDSGGYYYVKPYRYLSASSYGTGRQRYRGRITKLHVSTASRPFNAYGPPSQDRPFNQYGPPSQDPGVSISQESHHHQSSAHNIVQQETPVPNRYASFAEENPIASQNNQPFGQDTANYLPPKNQKLPEYSEPHIFSHHNHDFPQLNFQQQEHHQQQQFFQEQQQQYHHHHQQQQQQQFNFDQQNFLRQNQQFGQSEFGGQTQQQISDAALFLHQNAQAISDLYSAPAPNQNYGPANENQEVDQHLHNQHHQHQSLNLQVNSNGDNQPGFQGPLPSYASGVLNHQDSLEKIQSLEKDRLISQLQIQLSNQDTSSRFNQAVENKNTNYQQNENLQISVSSPSQHSSYQGFYEPSTPAAIGTTPSPLLLQASTTTLQPGQSSSSSSSSAVESSQSGALTHAQQIFRPAILNPSLPHYGGFVPSLVPSAGFVPSIPAPIFPKPIADTPTHFAIPLPTFDVPHRPVHIPPSTPVFDVPHRPVHIPPSTPVFDVPHRPVHVPPSTAVFDVPHRPPHLPPGAPVVPTRPQSDTPHPGTPTITIPLGPVNTLLPPAQVPSVKPGPVPSFPVADTPVQPTFPVHHHPTVVYPSYVYKPVKVHPVYYYPGVTYPVRKLIGAAASAHPWSYAPSYAQRRRYVKEA